MDGLSQNVEPARVLQFKAGIDMVSDGRRTRSMKVSAHIYSTSATKDKSEASDG